MEDGPPPEEPFETRRFYRYLRVGGWCALTAGAATAVAMTYLVWTASYPFEQSAGFSLGRKAFEVVTFSLTGAALGFMFGVVAYAAAQRWRAS